MNFGYPARSSPNRETERRSRPVSRQRGLRIIVRDGREVIADACPVLAESGCREDASRFSPPRTEESFDPAANVFA